MSIFTSVGEVNSYEIPSNVVDYIFLFYIATTFWNVDSQLQLVVYYMFF